MREVAIVGTAAPTSQLANQEPLFVEIWGCGGTFRTLHRIDRWYEMHTLEDIRRAYGAAFGEYLGFLKTLEVPCMMQRQYPIISQARAYPMETRRATFGTVLSSTIAYMLADAIEEGYERIKLFGVNMRHESEYGDQHAGCAYLIGWARAKGIDVIIPDQCPLLKYPLYGIFETEDADFVMRLQQLEKESKQAQVTISVVEGRKAELEHWRAWFRERATERACAPEIIQDGAMAETKYTG